MQRCGCRGAIGIVLVQASCYHSEAQGGGGGAVTGTGKESCPEKQRDITSPGQWPREGN